MAGPGVAAANHALLRLSSGILSGLSLERALRVADGIADLTYFRSAAARRRALEHLEAAFGNTLPAPARRRVARAAFRNLARCYCELLQFQASPERLAGYIEIEGREHLERVRAGGQGAVAVTGQTGNWELASAGLSLAGVPVAILAKRNPGAVAGHLVGNFRNRAGVGTINPERPNASRSMATIFDAGGIVTVLIDLRGRSASAALPLLGSIARPPAAAASLAIRLGLPVLPVFAQRRPAGGHRITVLPPIHAIDTGDRRRNTADLARALAGFLSERARSNPAESLWWHRQWADTPVLRAGLKSDVV